MSKTLVELATEVERQANAKKDFVADTRLLSLAVDNSGRMFKGVKDVKLQMKNGSMHEFQPTDLFHDQLGDRLGIPDLYYDKMREQDPELLAYNVNHWFQKEPEPRMVRVLDNRARAFLSKMYRPLDNYDMLTAVLPTLQEKQMQFISCEVTERRMYLKVLFPGVQQDVVPGDAVQAGLVISNSEVGAGSFRVEPFTYRLVCKNGLISEHVLRQFHVGRSQGGNDDDAIYEILSNAAKSADDKALFLKVRDIVNHSLKPEIFEKNVEKFRQSTEDKLTTNNIPQVVEVTRRKFGFSNEQGTAIMRHLIEGGSLTRWGLANAVTRTAQDQADYDMSTRFERAGGKIIELPPTDWKKISAAN